MKVSELIKELERLAKDDDPEVIVNVNSYYKSYSVASESIFQVTRYTGDEIRLFISLNKGLVVREKGNKNR